MKPLPLWLRLQNRQRECSVPTQDNLLTGDEVDLVTTRPKHKLTRPACAGAQTFRLQHDFFDGSIRVGRLARLKGGRGATATEKTPAGNERPLVVATLVKPATPPPYEEGEEPGTPTASITIIWECATEWESGGSSHIGLLRLNQATMDSLVASKKILAQHWIILDNIVHLRVRFSAGGELPGFAESVGGNEAPVLRISTEISPLATARPTYRLLLDSAQLCPIGPELVNWLAWQEKQRRKTAVFMARKTSAIDADTRRAIQNSRLKD